MKSQRTIVFQLVVAILVVIFENAEAFVNVYPRIKRSELSQADARGVGDPLFLTPLIECGDIEVARQKAKVQHPEMFDISSYAGYLTVNDKYNSNLFFWYFPATVDSVDAPVVLYLEGGPGASSLFGLFIHNGPFILTPNDTLVRRNDSWSNSHNLLYIDNPVGTGYSFTKSEAGYARNETQIGQETRKALSQFFKLFPSLRSNDFFITGESYAGKFVPAVSHAIHRYNPTTSPGNRINLKGLAIGNGFTDPLNQLVYGDYLYQIGLIDDNGREEFHALEEKARDLIRQNRHGEAVDIVGQLIEGDPRKPPTLFKNLTGYDFVFNILKTLDPIRVESAYLWCQRADVRRALHVGNVSFNTWGENVAGYMREDGTQSEADHLAELLDHYRVLIYTGHLDIVVAHATVHNYLKNLSWSGANDFKRAPRRAWRVDGELAGYAKIVGNLTEVLVREAGHLVAMDQPKWNLELIEKFTRGREL